MLEAMSKGMMMLDIADTIKVSIQQFYGIEINDFAVKVAKTALWIAEAQMWTETKKIISSFTNISDFLPLETYDNVVEGNALRIDWNEVVPNNKCNYIMGNPPFVGARLMDQEQKSDVAEIFKNIKNYGNIDYVGCWYIKSAEYMKNTNIETALVSTNSICQGEQTTILWKDMLNNGININFAHRTFRWDSEASLKAHVHCIIIGFSYKLRDKRVIYDNGKFNETKNINAYLVDAPNVLIDSRSNPICNVPEIGIGNKPIDDGNYLFTKDEMREFLKKEPLSEKYFKKFYGAQEFINNKVRYCLWVGDCEPNELSKMPLVLEKIKNVRNFRLSSKSEGTRKLAEKPTRFHVENMPKTNYLLIPRVSSENRRYIPIGFMNKNDLCSDSVHITEGASLYDFGILTSNVHMSWMRSVCGRLEMRYRYSKDIVYNNFPWPSPTIEQKQKIEKTAQMILDARNKYPNSSLADLYDELTMPPELRKAHQENDKAVMEAYGFNWKTMTESECVAELMKMYQELTKEN